VAIRRAVTKYQTNPLIVPTELRFKEKTVRATRGQELVDPSSGEIVAVATICTRKIVDTERFAKIYLDGVSQSFALGAAARKVFSSVLQVCEKDTDRIYLNFMMLQEDVKVDYTERTFHRGMNELIEKEFIAASTQPHMYWINPHVFFNGDRVRFMTEYVKEGRKPVVHDDEKDRAELEKRGQQRLAE